jgi:hypothetical protein
MAKPAPYTRFLTLPAGIERNREQALAIVNRLRAEATLRRQDASQSVKIGLSGYAALVEAPADPAAKFCGRNVPLALEVLGGNIEQGNHTRPRRAGRAACHEGRRGDNKGGHFDRQKHAESSAR